MPRIREYNSQTSAQTRPIGSFADPVDFGAGVGAGIARVGGGITAIADAVDKEGRDIRERLQRKQEQDEAIEVERQTAAARAKWAEEFTRRKTEAKNGAVGFTESFKTDFDKYGETTLNETNLSERGKARLQNNLLNVKAGLIDNAVAFESAAGAVYAREQVAGIFDQNTNAVRANPNLDRQTIADESRLIGGLVALPEAERTKLLRERNSAVTDAALDGSIDKLQELGNVDEIRSFMKNVRDTDAWKKDASPRAYATALDRLQRLDEHFSARRDSVAVNTLNERIAEASAGVVNGLSAAEAAVFPDPQARTLAEKKITAALRTGEAVRSVSGASYTDMVAMIQKDQEALQSPGDFGADSEVAKARMSVVQDRIRALKDDPVAYTLKNSEPVRKAYEKMATDPSPANVQNYVQAATVEQQRLAPYQMPRLLSAEQVAQVKTQITELPNSPEGADEALNRLSNLQRQWGGAWPQVYRQLASEKALSDAHIAAARMTDPLKQSAARVLLQTAAMKTSDLKDIIDQPNFETNMRTTVNAALEPFYRSAAYQSGGAQEMSRMSEAVKTLAIGYMVRGEKNLGDAVKRAAKDVVMDDFNWGPTYFMPKNVDPDQVSTGLRSIGYALSEQKIVPPRDLAGLRPEDIANGAVDALQANGKWVTNADNTGLVLTWPNAGREMVMVDRGGKRVPLQFTWDELKQASQQDAAEAKAAREAANARKLRR